MAFKTRFEEPVSPTASAPVIEEPRIDSRGRVHRVRPAADTSGPNGASLSGSLAAARCREPGEENRPPLGPESADRFEIPEFCEHEKSPRESPTASEKTADRSAQENRPPLDLNPPTASAESPKPFGPRMPGRPSIYKQEFCELVIEYMGKGLSLTAFAGHIRVNPATVYRWALEIPEFSEAVQVGKARRSEILEIGLLNATQSSQVVSRIFALKNASPDEFKDQVEIKSSHSIEAGSLRDVFSDALRLAMNTGVANLLGQAGRMNSANKQTIDVPYTEIQSTDDP